MPKSRIIDIIIIAWVLLSITYMAAEKLLHLHPRNHIRRPSLSISPIPQPKQPDNAIQEFPLPVQKTTPSERRPALIRQIYTIDTGKKPEPGSITSGTAFAVDSSGHWLTAWHVVDDCKQLYVTTPSSKPGKYVFNLLNKRAQDSIYTATAAKIVKLHPTVDMALIRTQESTYLPVPLAGQDSYTAGQQGFAMGYPEARAGEAALEYMGDGYGRDIRATYPLFVWALKHQSKDMRDFHGLSGGPLFDPEGRVVGVNVAGNIRRGRLMTTRPSSATNFLENNLPSYSPVVLPSLAISQQNYQNTANHLRKQNTIALVICIH